MFIAVGPYAENTSDQLPDVIIDVCSDLTYQERCRYTELIADAINRGLPKNLSREDLQPKVQKV